MGDGFRGYSVQNPSRIYLVRQEGARWLGNCPDFENHKTDTRWRCKHILAVAPWPKLEEAAIAESGDGHAAELPAPAGPNGYVGHQSGRELPDGTVRMLIERSVGPDGGIGSISVEFSMPVSESAIAETRAKALNTLRLQKQIVAGFFKVQGEKSVGPPPPTPKPTDPGRCEQADWPWRLARRPFGPACSPHRFVAGSHAKLAA